MNKTINVILAETASTKDLSNLRKQLNKALENSDYKVITNIKFIVKKFNINRKVATIISNFKMTEKDIAKAIENYKK